MNKYIKYNMFIILIFQFFNANTSNQRSVHKNKNTTIPISRFSQVIVKKANNNKAHECMQHPTPRRNKKNDPLYKFPEVIDTKKDCNDFSFENNDKGEDIDMIGLSEENQEFNIHTTHSNKDEYGEFLESQAGTSVASLSQSMMQTNHKKQKSLLLCQQMKNSLNDLDLALKQIESNCNATSNQQNQLISTQQQITDLREKHISQLFTIISAMQGTTFLSGERTMLPERMLKNDDDSSNDSDI